MRGGRAVAAKRQKNVNESGREYVEGRMSVDDFFREQKRKAAAIATRSVDARIAHKVAATSQTKTA